MAIEVTPKECLQVLEWNVKAQITTMIKGSPSTAKSAIAHLLAQKYNLLLIDQRLSQCEPEDLQGMPSINRAAHRSEYVPFDWIPLEGDPIPKGYDGWVLFLDELNAGEKPVTKAAYKLVLDRKVGNRSVHPRCAIIAAGNLDTDGALVEDQGTAMQSRMSYVRMRVDTEGWLEYAAENDFDHRITSFIEFKPGLLYTFDPEKASLDDNYACYRTWEFADRQLRQIGEDIDNPLALVALAGSVGEGVAREFLAHCKLEGTLPKVPAIVKDPGNAAVPTEPSALYALTGSLAHHANRDNIVPLVAYIQRIPKEFQVITLRQIKLRNPDLIRDTAVIRWIADSALELF